MAIFAEKFTVVTLILSMLAGWCVYSRSRYYPDGFFRVSRAVSGVLSAGLLLLVGMLCFFYWGWAVGIPVFLTVVPLAYCLVIFLLGIGSKYSTAAASFLLFLFLIDLFS